MIYKVRTQKTADALAKYFSAALHPIPYKDVHASTLGGLAGTSIIVRVSLDPRPKWKNGIYHNSRYAMFHLSGDGTLELFSRRYDLPKMRKTKAKSIPDAVKKMKDYLAKARKAKP